MTDVTALSTINLPPVSVTPLPIVKDNNVTVDPQTDNNSDVQVSVAVATNANENTPATYTALANEAASNIRGTSLNTSI